MTPEEALRDKLRKIEALFAGAATDGEKAASGAAAKRIRRRLGHGKPAGDAVLDSGYLIAAALHRSLSTLRPAPIPSSPDASSARKPAFPALCG